MKLNHAQMRQRSTVFMAVEFTNLISVLVQLWLFVSVLEGMLNGRVDMALPAGIASLALFGVNLWMLRGINRES